MKLSDRMAALRADPLLSDKQAALLLGVTWWTVRDWRKAGRLKFARLGARTVRIRYSEVERLGREA